MTFIAERSKYLLTDSQDFLDRWPEPDDVRGVELGRHGWLVEQVVCPHADTSKHRQTGLEHCNVCGAIRRYKLPDRWV